MKSAKINIKLASSATCTGCTACANVCKHNAIQMKLSIDGFHRPYIDKNACVSCGLCTKACPIVSKKEEIFFAPKIYAAINKDCDVLQKSSSGGAFYELAKWVLNKNGVVFGAKFDGVQLVHDYTEILDGVEPFMGSKYIQSDVADSYSKVKEFLLDNRFVLYSGTPCQIAGLKRFLNKNYSNLLTVDLLCHGVPSQVIWNKYITRLKKKLNAVKIKDIRFRTKRLDIQSLINFYFFFFFLGKDGKWHEYGEDCNKNLFFSYFMRHLFRPSCYDCQFRSLQSSYADFTIGDCWNAGVDHPDMNINNGISTIICHTGKAFDIMNDISTAFHLEEENIAVMHARYEEAKLDERREKKLRLWRLSNILAHYIPLQYIQFIYKHDRLDFVIKRKLQKVWQKNTK